MNTIYPTCSLMACNCSNSPAAPPPLSTSGLSFEEWLEGAVTYLPNGLKPVSCWAHVCANLALLISYGQTDMLRLRLILTISTIFWLLFGSLCLSYSLDTIMWNAIFLILNLKLLIPLILDRLPINLTDEEQWVYWNIFSRSFSKKQFRLFCDASCRLALAEQPAVTTLYSQGDVQSLFLVADRNASLTCLKEVDGVTMEVANYENVDCAWFGHVEYCLQSPTAMISVQGRAIHKQSMHFGSAQGVPPRAWQWTTTSLERLFRHPLHGQSIRNALDAVLMPNLAEIINARTDQTLRAGMAYSHAQPAAVSATPTADVRGSGDDGSASSCCAVAEPEHQLQERSHV